MKMFKLVPVTVFLLAIIFSISVCNGDGDPDTEPTPTPTPTPTLVPVPQEDEITGMFGIGAGATIKGTFADEDWEGVPERVKTALNAAFAEGNLMDKGRFRNLFGDNDVTIIMEKTTEYNHYKVVDGEFTTLYLNIASPLSVDDITAAVTAARNEEAAMAKVPPKGMGNDMKPAIYAAYGAVAGNAAYHLTA